LHIDRFWPKAYSKQIEIEKFANADIVDAQFEDEFIPEPLNQVEGMKLYKSAKENLLLKNQIQMDQIC